MKTFSGDLLKFVDVDALVNRGLYFLSAGFDTGLSISLKLGTLNFVGRQ